MISCKNKQGGSISSQDPGKKLASYKSKVLHESDIKEMYAHPYSGTSSENQFLLENWLKDQILLDVAEKNVKDLGEIDQLVTDYKNALLLHYYETQLVQEKLDSQISDKEFIEYYQSNKAEYKMDDTYVRMLLLKFPKSWKSDPFVSQNFGDDNPQTIQVIKKYCDNDAEVCLLFPQRWLKWKEVQVHIPSKLMNVNSLKKGLKREFADFQYYYFVKIIETLSPNQDPPLSYIQDKAKNTILRKRKNQLIETVKKELYQNEVKNKNVQIYQN